MNDIILPIKGCKVKHNTINISGRTESIVKDNNDFIVTIRCYDNQLKKINYDHIVSDFKTGDLVEHYSKLKSHGTGKVMAIRKISGFETLLVQFNNTGLTKWLPFQTLRAVMSVETRMIHNLVGNKKDHAERFRLRVLSKALNYWDENTGALGRLKIDPLPHQIHVAQKVITSGNFNWLIAEDVGLGKTIEVGLILHALKKKRICRRILVVCPSGLVKNWQEEMKDKFDQYFSIYNIDFTPDNLEKLFNNGTDNVIVSLDIAKVDKHKMMLLNGKWDLVIFDEAHRLTKGETGQESERYKFAKDLREHVNNFILLTATPHQGKTKPFQYLLELVRPDLKRQIAKIDYESEIISEIIIRNNKIEVTNLSGDFLFKGHDTHRYPVQVTDEMKNFDKSLRDYFQNGYKAQGNFKSSYQGDNRGRAIGFVMTTYRKLASSSIAAILKALQKRHDKLLCNNIEENNNYDFDSYDSEDNNDDLAQAEFNFTSFFDGEISQLKKLIDKARNIYINDAKMDTFIKEAVKPCILKNENILIFTEYKETQNYIVQKIRDYFPSVKDISQINGSMKLQDRIDSIEKFNSKENLILVSTEAGGEGVNLQNNCSTMINYDLPWNPSRLVQRIGRLYRYGQKKRVQVLNLSSNDNFDTKAIDLMINRVEQAAKDLSATTYHNKEGLEVEIIGNILSCINMEDILAKADHNRYDRTEKQIEEAIAKAKVTHNKAYDILSFSNKLDTVEKYYFNHHHLKSFVFAMLPFMNINLKNHDIKNDIFEIELSDESIGKYTEFGKQKFIRCSTNPEVHKKNIYPLDFKNSLIKDMYNKAQNREFDGLFACLALDNDEYSKIVIFNSRWQDDKGDILENKLVPTFMDYNNNIHIMPSNEFASFLIEPFLSYCEKIDHDKATVKHDCFRMYSKVEEYIKSLSSVRKIPALLYVDAGANVYNYNNDINRVLDEIF